MPTPLPISRRPAEVVAVQLKRCPFCSSDIPTEARKCRSCSEWVVGTSGGFAAAGLRLLGLLWAVITVLFAGGLWYLGQGIRRWAWMHALDVQITPQVIDLILYTLIAAVVLKGMMLSVGLGIMARMSPRRPRWWT